MINRILNISRNWQTSGWKYIFFGAIVVLFICWLLKDPRSTSGTYDKFEIVDTFNGHNQSTVNKLLGNYISNSPNHHKSKKYNKNSDSHGRSRVPTESKGEVACRKTLQQIFNKPFEKVRPDFLFNSVTGENLEFDMYDKELGLAVEYNGQQHYRFNSFMHQGSRDKFYGQQYRDKMKRDICKKLNITLIEVPYTVKNDDIPSFLVQELRKHNYIE